MTDVANYNIENASGANVRIDLNAVFSCSCFKYFFWDSCITSSQLASANIFECIFFSSSVLPCFPKCSKSIDGSFCAWAGVRSPLATASLTRLITGFKPPENFSSTLNSSINFKVSDFKV